MKDAQPAAAELSTAPFRPIPPPPRLIVPLSTRPPGENTGSAKPPGTIVARGEPLAEHVPETAHVPLSPVAGRIIATTRVDLLNGHRVAAVELEVSRTEPAPLPERVPWPESSELATWIDRLRYGGAWAERRNSPDLLAQLYLALRRPCDTVICTVLDGEDAVPLSASLARAFPNELLAGVRTLARAARATNGIVALDADAPAGDVRRLRRATEGDTAVRFVPLSNSYPQADPTLMLYSVVRRRLRPGRLPAEAGVILLDAAAAITVGRIARANEPMLTVPLAVRDVLNNTTHLVTAPVGTPLWHVLKHLGVREDAVPRVGEALRDQPASRDAIVGGGELVTHVGYASPSLNPDPCIRCGWCAAACPTRVQPAGLLEAAQRDDATLAERYGLDACIECGVCSYVCPSRLPLLGAIRLLHQRRRA